LLPNNHCSELNLYDWKEKNFGKMVGTTALPEDQIVAFYLGLGLLYIFARTLGEVARKIRQPAVLGEVS